MTDELKDDNHQWDIRKCIWCGKPHVKYPLPCAKGISKLVKKYGKERPAWVRQLVRDANTYLDAFRQKYL